MAGSWEHATVNDVLLVNEDFTGMIENGGDAYEMAEEMAGMIWYLAQGIGTSLTGDRDEIRRRIAWANQLYRNGLALMGPLSHLSERDDDED